MAGAALDILTAHYERMRGQKFEVPGITGPDGEPLVVYYDPPTNAMAQKIRKRAGDDEAKLTLYTVIYMAKNADGSPMFEENAATVRALTENVKGTILAQIAQAIMSVTEVPDLGN